MSRMPWRPIVRVAEKRIKKFDGIWFNKSVVVEYWTEKDCSWVFNSELEILAEGRTPAEAEMRFAKILIDKKLAALEWVRNGMQGEGMDGKTVQKLLEVL